MKKLNLYLLTILLVTAFSCSDDDDDNGSSAVVSGKIKATVDGEVYENNGVAEFKDIGSDRTLVSSVDDTNSDNNEVTFFIVTPLSPGETGTYNLNEDVSTPGTLLLSVRIDGTTYTNQQASELNVATIEVTDYSNDMISGTFSGTLGGSGGGEIEVENGTFTDIELQ